ncbi:MAG: carbohydrate ABC transporter permease [Lachnospiraceae bacterium]|nr:carbohydrate ABC transporter permease [Lachnospiraceae bacterium]MBO4762127.1 carbohydrate ABC transporter permease [Lachnospiraceae bacterium]MBQ6091980.1 carbohydrate ABC transporter permease [Lachnospiraceae bacterium]MBR5369012.1 carbohydrate ABC transporter permease [Lachnospiraceae bacterium]
MSKAKAVEGRRSFSERNRLSGGYLLKKTAGSVVLKILRFVLIFGLCFMIIEPIINKFCISIMTEKDIYDTTINILPRHLTTSNYAIASELMSFWEALGNSLWISIAVSLVQIAACTLTGYGFARFNFPLKRLWFACVILIIIIPPQTISSSLYLHFRFFDIFGIFQAVTGEPINLRGSVLPYFLMSAGCMGLKNGLYIFLVRQYFRGIPKDVEEAAYVDGCGTLKTFFRIMLPDAKPIITSCFLFSFVWQWTDSFYSSLFIGGKKLLSTGLASLADNYSNYISVVFQRSGTLSEGALQQMNATGVLMVVTPIILLYLIAQKGFVESLSSTGIKM